MTEKDSVFVTWHQPDLAHMEAYWMWYCTCGDTSEREFATREDAEDDAEDHAYSPITAYKDRDGWHGVGAPIDVSPVAFVEIDPDDYRLPPERANDDG